MILTLKQLLSFLLLLAGLRTQERRIVCYGEAGHYGH